MYLADEMQDCRNPRQAVVIINFTVDFHNHAASLSDSETNANTRWRMMRQTFYARRRMSPRRPIIRAHIDERRRRRRRFRRADYGPRVGGRRSHDELWQWSLLPVIDYRPYFGQLAVDWIDCRVNVN